MPRVMGAGHALVRLQAQVREGFEYRRVHGCVDEVFGASMHAKHAVQQVDRWLGSAKPDVRARFADRVPYRVGALTSSLRWNGYPVSAE